MLGPIEIIRDTFMFASLKLPVSVFRIYNTKNMHRKNDPFLNNYCLFLDLINSNIFFDVGTYKSLLISFNIFALKLYNLPS
jgi:hypothetical protein